MSTEKDPLYKDGDTIHTDDGVENPAGPQPREPKRIHSPASLCAAVREWESEAAAPWAGYRPHPEQEGEVCTEITTKSIDSCVDGTPIEVVHFTRRIKVDDDVQLVSVATVTLAVHETGAVAAALAWGEGEQGFNASLGRATVKDTDKAVSYLLDQVYAMVQRAPHGPTTQSKHAWMVANAAANMMVSGLVHGGGTPAYVPSFTGVTWYPEHWLVMLAVLKDAINLQTGRSRGLMPGVHISDAPQVPDSVDPQTSVFQVVHTLKVRGYPKVRYVIEPDTSRDGKAQGLWALSITAPHVSGKPNIYPTLALAQGGVSTVDIFRMCASAADFMSAANAVGDRIPAEYSIDFAADPSDLAWWKRHFDEAQKGELHA